MDKVEDIVGRLRMSALAIREVERCSPAYLGTGSQIEVAADLIQSQQSLIEEMKEALETSHVALNDWLNVYASDMCDPARVREAQDRVGSGGTIAYVAHVTAKIREALSQKDQIDG